MNEITVVCLKRKNGKIVQDCDIYIGRKINMGGWNLPQSKWANPYKIKDIESIDKCLQLYEEYIRSNKILMMSLSELQGKTLGCWCKPKKCHGDILIKLLKELV